MGTYTLRPTKVCIFDLTTRVISQVITDQNAVFNVDGTGIIAEFDTSTINYFGRTEGDGTNQAQAILQTMSRIPTAASWNSHSYLFKNIETELAVGKTLLFSDIDSANAYTFGGSDSNYPNVYSWGMYPYISSNPSNKFYVKTTYHAEGVSDQLFKMSDFRVTFNAGTSIAFTADTDFGGGYHNPANALSIKAIPVYNIYGFRQYSVSGGTLYYKKTTDQNYTSIAMVGDTGTIPANTLISGNDYDIYLSVTSGNSETTTTSPVVLTTTDGTAVTTPVRPSNELCYGEVVFDWSYSVSTGEDQYAYDVAISADGGDNWTTIKNHVVSSETSTTYTQNTAGDTLWKVRGYNQNDTAGNWSDPAYYVNVIPPNPPTVTTISGSGRKTVSWSAGDQIAYEMEVVNSSGKTVYKTGQVYTTVKSALINEYLDADAYTIRIRVAGSAGLWSDWATAQTTISISLTAPSFTLAAEDSGVLITITPDASFDYFYVIRNGLVIAKADSTYTDRFVSGSAVYKVIGVASDDSYAYASQVITFQAAHDYIAMADGTLVSCNMRWNSRVHPSRSASPRYSTFEYLGESLPSHAIAAGAKRATFVVAASDENSSFDSLIGQPVYFNTRSGWGEWCIVTSLNRNEILYGNETTLTMEADSFNEGIEYDL